MSDELNLDPPTQRGTSFGSFLLSVLVVILLGSGAVYWYYGRQVVQKEIADLTMQARNKMNRHDLNSLREAEALYRDILTLDSGEQQTLASMARTLFYQADHGIDSVGQANSFLEKARAAGSETPSRWASEGYSLVWAQKGESAVSQIKGWLEEGKAAPPVAHALAMAHVQVGEYVEANRVCRQAREADFSNIAIQLTMADASHHAGEEKQAIKELSGIVRSNANDEHLLARAKLAALRAKNYGSLTSPANHINYLKEADEEQRGPTTNVMLTWAEGELSLALGNAEGAVEKADQAAKEMNDYPPALDLKARALLAQGKVDEAIEAYRKAVAQTPLFRGTMFDLAELLSKRQDDEALAIIDELEKSDPAKYKGARYLVFKAEHALRKGNLEEATALFTKAADEGDDPAILFGLAKIAFEEEKQKNKKADLERVGAAFEETLSKRRRYPEVHEYLAGISLWNWLPDGATAEYEQAEKQYKALKRPIPEIVAFYDRAIAAFDGVTERSIRRDSQKQAELWRQKKLDYLQSLQGG